MEQKNKTKETMNLASCMLMVIGQLREEKKYSAVHTYTSTLNSFTEFSGKKMIECR